MTLLMFATKADWKDLIDELIDSAYDLNVQDNKGMTAGMYLAERGYKNQVVSLYDIIGVKAAGVKSKTGRSLLTYVGDQRWRELADKMFVDGISIDCSTDMNDIISNYVTIVRQINQIQKDAKNNFETAKKCVIGRPQRQA